MTPKCLGIKFLWLQKLKATDFKFGMHVPSDSPDVTH